MSPSNYALAALLAITASPALAGNVWVVDDDGGPGVDFTDVDSAVAAAADGDTLLIRAGAYSDLFIKSKGLTVVADTGAAPTFAGASVRGLAALQRVRLSGLLIQSPTEAGLQIKNNAGAVWVEDCVVRGADGDGAFTAPVLQAEGYPGIEVVASDSVSVARCSLVGGDGDDYQTLVAVWGEGGAGLRTSGGSRVAVLGSDLVGGRGGNLNDDDTASGGGAGGSGVLALDGEVYAVGNVFTGGDGGIGGEDNDLFTGYGCGNGGDAGSGIQGSFPGTNLLVHTADNTFVHGVPGGPFSGSTCSAGGPGFLYNMFPISHDSLATFHLGLAVTNPVREGQPLALSGSGKPGAAVFLAVGSAPAWSFVAPLDGLQLVDPLGILLFPLGTVDGAGTFATVFPVMPSIVAPGESLDFYLQVFGLDPVTSVISLGTPAGLSLLDASL